MRHKKKLMKLFVLSKRNVAKIACAEGDTMGNMPMKVTEEDVYNAMIAANALAHRYK